MTILTERAKWLARLVHEGQTRKNGEPYYTHCDAVAEGVKDKDENTICAAYMHDVLEDASNPDLIRKLLDEYFPQEIIHLVETLTHDKNIYYSRYIDVVSNNPKALIIKFEDMIHNTNDADIPAKQIDKYREAVILIIKRGKEIPQILKERLKIDIEQKG